MRALVPAGDTVGATGTRGALPVLLLDVIVFDYVYALGACQKWQLLLPPRGSSSSLCASRGHRGNAACCRCCCCCGGSSSCLCARKGHRGQGACLAHPPHTKKPPSLKFFYGLHPGGLGGPGEARRAQKQKRGFAPNIQPAGQILAGRDCKTEWLFYYAYDGA